MFFVKNIKSGLFKNDGIPEEFKDIKSLRYMSDKYFTKGRKVRVIENKRYVQIMQNGNGGWVDEMTQCLGQVCTVIRVDSDKSIFTRTPSHSEWLFHRAVFEFDDVEFEEDSISLFNSIEEGNTERFNEIIQFAYLNIMNKEKRTLINLACFLNKVSIVKFLCSFGADVNIPDENGDLPIHHSVLNGNIEIFKILSSNYPESVYEERERLLDIARNSDNTMLESTIRETMCKMIYEKKTAENKSINKFQSLLEIGLKNNRLSIVNRLKPRSLSEDVLTSKDKIQSTPQNHSSSKNELWNIVKHKVEASSVSRNLENSLETLGLLDPPETLEIPSKVIDEVPKFSESDVYTSLNLQFASIPVDETIISSPLYFKIDSVKESNKAYLKNSWKDILN